MIPLVRRKPPTGLLRLCLRLPIWLYRAHCGWLLGDRFLLLVHRGRKSGRLRRTVVEIVHHDKCTGTYTIASGWGEQSNWLRNIEKTPEATVRVGRQAFTATSERLSLDAAEKMLFAYARRHRVAFRLLTKVIIGQWLRGTAEGCRTMARHVPVVALRPRGSSKFKVQ